MNQNNQGQRQMDTFDYLKVWWNECPLFTKSLLYICCGTFILEIFIPIIPYLFPNRPDLTLGGLQLQRLFFSGFYSQGILNLLFGFLVFLPVCSRKEREWGTVKVIVDYFYKTFLINLAFCAFCYAFGTIISGLTKSGTYGLWPIYFYYLVERCLLDPNGVSQVFCFPIHVRNTLYPIILLLLFSLFSGTILFDLLVAIGVGWIHFKFLNPGYHNFLNEQKCSAWESNILFNWLRSLPNYVSPSGNMFANNAQQPAAGSNVVSASNNAPSRPAPGPFNAFAGKGITLGTDEAPAASNIPRAQNGNYAELNDDSGDMEQGRSPVRGQ